MARLPYPMLQVNCIMQVALYSKVKPSHAGSPWLGPERGPRGQKKSASWEMAPLRCRQPCGCGPKPHRPHQLTPDDQYGPENSCTGRWVPQCVQQTYLFFFDDQIKPSDSYTVTHTYIYMGSMHTCGTILLTLYYLTTDLWFFISRKIFWKIFRILLNLRI